MCKVVSHIKRAWPCLPAVISAVSPSLAAWHNDVSRTACVCVCVNNCAMCVAISEANDA